MTLLDSRDMCIRLHDAPVDERTGNKVIYNASFKAVDDSMIGARNEDWVRRELDWFVSGSNNLADMKAPVPGAFQQCAGEDGTVNSAYGHILFSRNGEDLPDSVRETSLYRRMVNTFIKEGKHTRHAVAIITDRDIHTLYRKNGRQDFICTNAINAMIDTDDQLHLTIQMRSMDAVWGYRADYSMWKLLMTMMVKDLSHFGIKVVPGDIVFQVANLHVYPRHFELLEREADRVSDDLNREARRIWMNKVLRERIIEKEKRK